MRSGNTLGARPRTKLCFFRCNDIRTSATSSVSAATTHNYGALLKMKYTLVSVSILVVALIALVSRAYTEPTQSPKPKGSSSMTSKNGAPLSVATFAGGCFWCMQPPFDSTTGVEKTLVGYAGGKEPNPTYDLVSSGRTGYAEAVQVYFDAAKVSYEQLLEIFWRNIDPTQPEGQFADRGPQYRTAIFYQNEEQKKRAENSKAALQASSKFGRPIVTEISPATEFYAAEEYHQDYYKKNETHYKLYRAGSGRAGFIERTWGSEKPPK